MQEDGTERIQTKPRQRCEDCALAFIQEIQSRKDGKLYEHSPKGADEKDEVKLLWDVPNGNWKCPFPLNVPWEFVNFP